MNLPELIGAIRLKYTDSGITIYPPATAEQITKAEEKLYFKLPAELIAFYSLCNGFACSEDRFTILGLNALFRDDEYGLGCVIFAERLVYSEVWAFRILDEGRYEIVFNDSEGKGIILTHSLTAFLEKLLRGHTPGLQGWFEERRKHSL